MGIVPLAPLASCYCLRAHALPSTVHRAIATQFNKSCRSASNVTMLVGLQTLASQPRSSGWFHNPEVIGTYENWRRLQILESLLIEEHKPELNANIPSMPLCIFDLLQSFMPHSLTSLSISIGTHPAESREHLCFAPLRHYRNKSRFSFLTALFSWPTIRSCSKIITVQLQIHWYWWQVLPKPLQKVVCIVIFVRYFHKDNNDI